LPGQQGQRKENFLKFVTESKTPDVKKLLSLLTPPQSWRTPVAVLLGIFCGLGMYAIYISKAESYLGEKPETCINCHVMNPQYANWAHNAHRRVATCNDCHVPHNNILSKYFFKAKDGLRHATMFTFRLEPQVIVMKSETRPMVQKNCIRCHEQVVGMNFLGALEPGYTNHLQERYCLDCHREEPHGLVNGLSSTPHALNVQKNRERIPGWLSIDLKRNESK
jgi:cytochrome c nitrite reductase small subunit